MTVTEAHELVEADPDLPDRQWRTVGLWIDDLEDAGALERVDGSKPRNIYTLG